jgi:Fe-S oxidoreductase
MTDFVFPGLGKKVIDFLTRHGVEVTTPKEQGCCGAPVFLGAGDLETGRKMADVNTKLFENVDYVVSDCATCSSALKEYAKFLADTPEKKEAYSRLGDKVRDVSQFLVEVLKLPLTAYQPVPEIRGKKITWHDPCHLARHLGVKEQPRKIMRSLADVEYIEMARADFCCGMGGNFAVSYPDLSKKIGDKAAETIKATEADIVVTACPGCMIQLIDTCKRHKMPQKVAHIMEVLE